MKKFIIILSVFISTNVIAQTKAASSYTKDCSIFINAIASSDLSNIYNGNAPLTIFIPDNTAFQKLPAGAMDSLLKPENKAILTALLGNHIIKGVFTAKNIAKQINLNSGKAAFTTLAGTKLTATIDANRNIVLTDENGNQTIIKVFDIKQDNKILFIVNSVINYKK